MSADIFQLRFCAVCKGWVGVIDGSRAYCVPCLNDLMQLPERLPATHYEPDEHIDLVRPLDINQAKRPKIEGVNIPVQGETVEELNAFRARYGLVPVSKRGGTNGNLLR